MTRTVAILVVVCSGLAAAQAPPQQKLASEVASIKPIAQTGSYSYKFTLGGGFTARLPLEWMIGVAYDIRPFERIVGEPSWARTQFFDIEAKAAGPASRNEVLAMLRTLIEDRFGLVWRLDPTGKMNVYTLRMARDDGRLGPGIRRSEASCLNALGAPVSDRQLRAGMPVPCGSAQANGVHAAGNMRLGMLATMLQLTVDEEVIDRTGLTGTFDFYITLPREGTNPSLPGDVSIFTAVQEQLGMKLQREEITRDMFLVEKVSQPTPN